MAKSERQLKIILFLQSKNRWTVNELAEYFNVSRRTIFRDLRDIQELNVPLLYDPLKGHTLMEGYKIPPLMFTHKELSVIGIALSFMQTQPHQGLANDSIAVENKIYSALTNEEMKDYLKKIQDSIIINPYIRERALKEYNSIWFILADAIASSTVISFLYEKSKNKDRILSPYLIVFFKDHWNLIGYDHTRKEIRSFIIEHIKEVSSSPFTPYFPSEFSDKKELIYSSKKRDIVKISIKTKKVDEILSSLPGKVLSVKKQEKWTKLELEFNNPDYLANSILQFGTDIQIKSPTKYVQSVKSILKELKQLYS